MGRSETGLTDHEIDEGLRSLAHEAEAHEPSFGINDICSRPRWPGNVGRIATAALLVVASAAISVVALQSARGHRRTSISTATTSTITGVALPQVDHVYFLNATFGWAAADNSSRLLITSDGGRRWRDVSPPALLRKGFILGSGLAGGSFLSPSDFWVSVIDAREDGLFAAVVFHTTNGGRSWSEVGSFPKSDGNAWVEFVNDVQGWVEVGNGQVANTESVTIYATTSGGRRWSIASRSMSATGGKGTVGGPPLSGDKTGLAISGASGTSGVPTLWLSSTGTVTFAVSRSTDAGRLWSGPIVVPHLPVGGGGVAYPPVFVGSQHGVFQGAYGTSHGSIAAFYSTGNGGDTWIQHLPPSPAPRLLDVVTPATWFAASGSTLYITTDGGVRWSKRPTSIDLGSSAGSGELDFVTTLDGWAVLGSQQLWRTTDGGRLWTLETVHT